MSDHDQDQEFSLAALAGLDVSDIAEVRYETLPNGAFVFEGDEIKFEKTTNKDDEVRFLLTAKLKVVEVKAITDRMTDEQKEAVVGKTHTEKFYVVPEKAGEGIGRIRAFFADMGLPNGGAIGAAEDEDGNPIEGFADGLIGHQFEAKIVARPRRDDPSQKDARLRFAPKK